MSMPGIGELLIIFLIILIVFGAGRIPKIARDLGSGIKEFKKALSGESDRSETESTAVSQKTAKKRVARKNKA